MGKPVLKTLGLVCLAGLLLLAVLRLLYPGTQEKSSGVGAPAMLTSNTREAVEGAGKIPLDAQRWYQLTDAPDGIPALFDGITNANIPRGWGKLLDQYQAYYPLLKGESFVIENVKMYDGEGSSSGAPMVLSILTDTWEQIPIATFTGSKYRQWVGPDPREPTVYALGQPIRNARYLVITSGAIYPTEIELYGSYKAAKVLPAPSASALAAQKAVKLSQMFGVNGFEWNLEDGNNPSVVDPARLAAVQHFSGIRHYLDWERLEPQPGSYTFNPSHNGSWNYDAMYTRLKQEGVEVLVCLKTLPKWLQDSYPPSERDAENVPAPYGKDRKAPGSYVEQARLAFQVAARYGSNPSVPRELVRVSTRPPRWTADPVNEVKTGLGVIRYMECENERDKWWKGRKAYQTAAEYAANLSAFYDGHKNTLGPGVGVKNADPKMQVVMGGLAAPTPDYVKGMVDWCRQNRGYRPDGSVNLCWDVINYHLYANDAGTSQGGQPTRGAAPEVSEAGQVAQKFVQMAHAYAGGMPVWITETGYDLNQGSPLKAIAIGKKSVLDTQADWILRTSLLYARWGVERVFLYQLYDDNPQNPTRFGSMGLLNDDKTPRPAAQYLQQANLLLGAYRYKQTLHTDPIVDQYELKGRLAYVLVVPDEKGRTASYTLNLGRATYAEVYRPAIGKAQMDKQRVALQNGQLTLQVTETPVFVLGPAVP